MPDKERPEGSSAGKSRRKTTRTVAVKEPAPEAAEKPKRKSTARKAAAEPPAEPQPKRRVSRKAAAEPVEPAAEVAAEPKPRRKTAARKAAVEVPETPAEQPPAKKRGARKAAVAEIPAVVAAVEPPKRRGRKAAAAVEAPVAEPAAAPGGAPEAPAEERPRRRRAKAVEAPAPIPEPPAPAVVEPQPPEMIEEPVAPEALAEEEEEFAEEELPEEEEEYAEGEEEEEEEAEEEEEEEEEGFEGPEDFEVHMPPREISEAELEFDSGPELPPSMMGEADRFAIPEIGPIVESPEAIEAGKQAVAPEPEAEEGEEYEEEAEGPEAGPEGPETGAEAAAPEAGAAAPLAEPLPGVGAPPAVPGAPPVVGERRRRRRRHRHRGGPRDPLLTELRRFFRIQQFRPKQREVVEAVLAGKDTVAIMPTGSGKSLTYQLSAHMLPGLTIVISPLIALLRDQYEKLLKYGMEGARLDSSLTAKQREQTMVELESGKNKLLLITPEGATSEVFRQRISGRKVSLLVIDEAHCVSQWGHDFRPSYLVLDQVAEQLGRPPILALTATATTKVQDDIIAQLGMRDVVRIVAPPYRPNLAFDVELHDSEMSKLRGLLRRVRMLPRPGIIYCSTVRDVEMVWAMLRKARIKAEHYHGKMLKSERDAAHTAFMDGRAPLVMVATNAFGLGVDKPNIRYVIHYQVPGSLEAYVQEAGRAGRDGKPSRCILQFYPRDLEIQQFFLDQQYPSRNQVRQVAEALTAWSKTGQPVTLKDLALSARVPQTRAGVVLRLLMDMHFATEVEAGKSATLSAPPPMAEVERAASIYDVQRLHDRRRLDELTRYANTEECRSAYIGRYFGQEDAPRCGVCDNDRPIEERAREAAEMAQIPLLKPSKKRRRGRHGHEADEGRLDRRGRRRRGRRGPGVSQRQAQAGQQPSAGMPGAQPVPGAAANSPGIPGQAGVPPQGAPRAGGRKRRRRGRRRHGGEPRPQQQGGPQAPGQGVGAAPGQQPQGGQPRPEMPGGQGAAQPGQQGQPGQPGGRRHRRRRHRRHRHGNQGQGGPQGQGNSGGGPGPGQGAGGGGGAGGPPSGPPSAT